MTETKDKRLKHIFCLCTKGARTYAFGLDNANNPVWVDLGTVVHFTAGEWEEVKLPKKTIKLRNLWKEVKIKGKDIKKTRKELLKKILRETK